MSEDQTNRISQQPSELSQLIALVHELKEKVELRHYDTRSIWELVSGEINQLRLAQQETNGKVDELIGKLEEVRQEFNGKVEKLRQEVAAFRADTNHNFKVLDRKIREAFGDIGDLRGRLSFIEQQFPQEEIRT